MGSGGDEERLPAEQAAREARIKHLIERLEESSPEPRAQADQTTLLLDTTADDFIKWLRQKSRAVRKRKFPLPGGYILLQEARRSKRGTGDTGDAGDVIAVTIDGLLHESGATFLHYKQILFLIFPLAGGGIAVQAKCSQPAVASYYAELLAELG